MSRVELPAYAEELFKPYRYKFIKGGRGSAKSTTIARALSIKAQERPLKILCAREYQNSIRDSVHALLKEQAYACRLEAMIKVTEKEIHTVNGSQFLFKGVHLNVDSIKSIPDIDILWLEEGQTISQRSWDILVPTIRAIGSEIWVSYNPENEDDPTHVKCLAAMDDPDSLVITANWRDNPWFPEVLERERLYDLKNDPEKYQHVWEGEPRSISDAMVFKGRFSVDTFDIQDSWGTPLYGADWGFSVDPSTIVRCYLDAPNYTIYVRNAVGGTKIDFKDLPALWNQVPEANKHIVNADSARPETISFMNQNGFTVTSCDKWKGSVEDGIAWLKNFKIVIHPEAYPCFNEFRKYSYKVDRLTGLVTRDIIDDHNHYIDAIRYAFEKKIKQKGSILFNL